MKKIILILFSLNNDNSFVFESHKLRPWNRTGRVGEQDSISTYCVWQGYGIQPQCKIPDYLDRIDTA